MSSQEARADLQRPSAHRTFLEHSHSPSPRSSNRVEGGHLISDSYTVVISTA